MMKKSFTLLIIIFCQFSFGQEDYSKYKPVEPLYDNGGVDKFYQYLSKNIDFTKVANENDVIIGFVLDKNGNMNHIKVAFCNSIVAENEITSVLQKAKQWDLSNQKNNDFFICYKIKLIFSGNEVKGLQKTMWFRDDVQDIKLDKVEFNMSKEKLSNNSDTIYNTVGVESKPEYPGGIGEFLSFIGKNYKSPNDKNFKGGKVIVSFVVEKDGSLADIKVLKEAGYETGKEAIRVLKLCEKWKSATQLGLPVRCSYMLPINLVAN